MPDFNIRSDSVNVEQIMEQIRARIREKRGVDYTEEQLRELAAVKLEKFLDPRGVRSDLIEQFKRRQPFAIEPIVLPAYTFEDTTIYETHRGLLRFIRSLFKPILKLFFNPNALIHALHAQTEINALIIERDTLRERQRQERREMDALYYEVIHNLVFEMTRLGIETKNLKMRVESIGSRLEFNERRARALESVVVYRPSSDDAIRQPLPPPPPGPQPPSPVAQGQPPASTVTPPPQGASVPAPAHAAPEGAGQRSRRRRRRRGRRSGPSAVAMMGQPVPPTIDEPSSDDEPSSEQTLDEEEPGVLLEPASAIEVQAGETHVDAPAQMPTTAQAPESAGPGTVPDADDQQ